MKKKTFLVFILFFVFFKVVLLFYNIPLIPRFQDKPLPVNDYFFHSSRAT